MNVGRPCSNSKVMPAGVLVLAEPLGRSSGGISFMRCAVSKVRDTICVNVAVSTQGTVDCSSWRGSVPVRGGANMLGVGIPAGCTGAVGGRRGIGAVRKCDGVGAMAGECVLLSKGASLWSKRVLTDARIASMDGPDVWASCG